MIYDTFLFNDQLDHLDLRLHELQDVVDKFIIVEGLVTFSGKPKPLHFVKNSARYDWIKDKLVSVVVRDMPPGWNPWIREFHQRDAVKNFLPAIDCGDMIHMGDVDEIPSRDVFAKYKGGLAGPAMKMYRFYADWYESSPACSRIADAGLYNTTSVLKMRQTHADYIIDPGGWHFTYMGGLEAVRKKIHEYSHCYDAPCLAVIDQLERGERPRMGEQVTVPFDETYPQYMIENFGQFRHWFSDAVSSGK